MEFSQKVFLKRGGKFMKSMLRKELCWGFFPGPTLLQLSDSDRGLSMLHNSYGLQYILTQISCNL